MTDLRVAYGRVYLNIWGMHKNELVWDGVLDIPF